MASSCYRWEAGPIYNYFVVRIARPADPSESDLKLLTKADPSI
ncbi:MAG: hypothetical protein ACI9UK_000556, partial [Candidatus Krumholzibacteriia bacterium]